MRRTDREITNIQDILSILDRCDVCRLGLSLNDRPYIVPMNFGYEYADGQLTLYFHCAKEGQKLDILRANPNACFEMDGTHQLIAGERACEFSMAYESVIGFGQISVCDDMAVRRNALRALMRKYMPEKEFSFTPFELDSVAVLVLLAESFTGKRGK